MTRPTYIESRRRNGLDPLFDHETGRWDMEADEVLASPPGVDHHSGYEIAYMARVEELPLTDYLAVMFDHVELREWAERWVADRAECQEEIAAAGGEAVVRELREEWMRR